MNTFAHVCHVNELMSIDGSPYVLKACLLHQNTDVVPNPRSGHYVALARHEGGFHSYWLYDDSICKNMNLTTCLQWAQQNHFRVYACLYERAEPETPSESNDMPPVYEPEVEAPSESGTLSSAETSDEEGDGPEELYFVVASDPKLRAEQPAESDIVMQRCQALRKNYAYDLLYQ